jgi:hypothetical protein
MKKGERVYGMRLKLDGVYPIANSHLIISLCDRSGLIVDKLVLSWS